MSRVFDKVHELMGTGSMPTTDGLGNTSPYGSYTASGIDFWSLPGVISPMPHNGVFKKGPVALYTVGDRHYWWSARIRDANTPIVDIYTVSPVGATFRYSSSVLPAMPRSFDFELNQAGHVVLAAEVEERLYGFYSFSSSLGWQLISSKSFTPKLTYVSATCALVYVDNDSTYGGVGDRWYPSIKYQFSTGTFNTGSTLYISGTLVPSTLPDTISVPSGTFGGVYYGWSGSLSGTMSGQMTGSMKGIITGTINDSLYGSFRLGPPSIYYGDVSGELSGSFGGTFVGTAIATGSFWGTIIGNFSGTYYTASGGSVSSVIQGMGTAPAGNNFFVGNISGSISGAVYPHSQSVVKPVYFIQDLTPTKGNRLQLTYGRYDPIAQHASYTSALSSISVTNTPTSDVVGGGVPFAVEVYQPTIRTSPPFAPMSAAYESTGVLGLNSITANYASSGYMTYWRFINGIGRYIWMYSLVNPAQSVSYHLRMTTDQNVRNTLADSGKENEFVFVKQQNDVGGNPKVPTPIPGAYLIGCAFPSESRNNTTFAGTHEPISASYPATLTTKIWQYAIVGVSPIVVVTSQSFGTDIGVTSPKNEIYAGVKLRPILSEPTAALTCSLVVNPSSNFVAGTGSQRSFLASSSDQVLLATLPVFTYSPVQSSATVSGSPAPAMSKTWYPDVTLYLSFTGSLGTTYFTSMSTTSYLLYTTPL